MITVKFVKALRLAKKYTQEAAASKTKVPVSVVRAIESGRSGSRTQFRRYLKELAMLGKARGVTAGGTKRAGRLTGARAALARRKSATKARRQRKK
jgi:transcriptional regulator with XRE-family HTH domain